MASSPDEWLAHIDGMAKHRLQFDRHKLEFDFAHRIARDIHEIVDQADHMVSLALEHGMNLCLFGGFHRLTQNR